MPVPRSFRKKDLPPCPSALLYILVRLKDNTYYWRLRRGVLKPAVLNSALSQNAELVKYLSPLLHRITAPILTFFNHGKIDRLHIRLLGPILKSYKEQHHISYNRLTNVDLLPESPLHSLFTGAIEAFITEPFIIINVQAGHHHVKKHNALITDYYFELLLIAGDIDAPGPLVIQSEQSELLSFSDSTNKVITFQFALPQVRPLMVLLKLACFEGDQYAAHNKHYGIKIILTG